jgi:mRNA-degrading endonuclease toxin of MazEF toxin-antitoxin module
MNRIGTYVLLPSRAPRAWDCVLNCDWLVTIAKVDLVERAGALSAAKLRKLDEAL